MAIRHIREAFDQEAGDGAQCLDAFLDYVSALGGQKQVITLKVVTPDGEKHTLQTPVHAMEDDPHLHVRATARKFVDVRAKAPTKTPMAPVQPAIESAASATGAVSTPAADPMPEAGPNPRPVAPRRDGGSAGGQLKNPFID